MLRTQEPDPDRPSADLSMAEWQRMTAEVSASIGAPMDVDCFFGVTVEGLRAAHQIMVIDQLATPPGTPMPEDIKQDLAEALTGLVLCSMHAANRYGLNLGEWMARNVSMNRKAARARAEQEAAMKEIVQQMFQRKEPPRE